MGVRGLWWACGCKHASQPSAHLLALYTVIECTLDGDGVGAKHAQHLAAHAPAQSRRPTCPAPRLRCPPTLPPYRAALAALLNELVCDFEVMRKGSSAAMRSAIDLDDPDLKFLPL